MLVYLSTAYSQIDDKNRLMRDLMAVVARLTELHRKEKWHIVTPLFNHFILGHMTTMRSDYDFWKEYSRELLERCQLIVVVEFPGMDLLKSVGVQDEIRSAFLLKRPVIYIKPEDLYERCIAN